MLILVTLGLLGRLGSLLLFLLLLPHDVSFIATTSELRGCDSDRVRMSIFTEHGM